jgi:hypothetical protein
MTASRCQAFPQLQVCPSPGPVQLVVCETWGDGSRAWFLVSHRIVTYGARPP